MNLYPDSKTKIIEFIGPPGIGKSTIFKSLCQKWKSNSKWIHQDKLLLMEKPAITDTRTWLEYQLRKLTRKNGNKNIHVDFGLRFAENQSTLVKFLWDHICVSDAYTSDEAGKKFRSAYFLFRDFCRYQAIWESKSTRPCIIDEGLFVKSFLLLPNQVTITEIIDTYLQLLTLPHAVVYINTADPDIIVDRLLGRKKIIASHKGKDKNALLADTQKWQFLFSLIIEKLQFYQTPVFNIDGSKPVDENVMILEKLLNGQPINQHLFIPA